MLKSLFSKFTGSKPVSAARSPQSPEPSIDPGAEPLQRAINDQREKDPLIGAKLGGKEIFQKLLNGMKDNRGVHVESLLCALGSLAGYACQANLRAQAVEKGLPEIAALIKVETADGKSYLFGDPLNQALAESQYSVWGLAAGAAQHNGCKTLPDINPIFAHVTATAGTPAFGIPRLPEGHPTSDTPINYLKTLWPVLLPTVKFFGKHPTEWPVMFGFAIQEALDMGKFAISQENALQIVMESAIPMSKVDLAAA